MTASAGAGTAAGALAALAADLEALTVTVEQLARETASNGEAVESVHRAVRTLAETVTATAAAAASVGDDDDSETSAAAPGPWLTTEDPGGAARDLDRLVKWLGEVYVNYHDAELGACWMWHPGVVAELMALRDGWTAAHSGQRASAVAVMDWHDRYRPGTVRRIATELANCRLDHHAPSGTRAYRPPTVPGVDLAGEIAAWWTRTHGRSSAPSPTPDMLAADRAAHTAKARDRY